MAIQKKTAKKVPGVEKRKPGRPATGRKRGSQMVLRMTDEERAAIDAAAEAAGTTAGAWALGVMLKAAGVR